MCADELIQKSVRLDAVMANLLVRAEESAYRW